jgi:endonuclease/exonuclease/phosphatase family metal-dependent hydrolase
MGEKKAWSVRSGSIGIRFMKCMTFNLRFQNDRDGENAWEFRKDLVVQVVQRRRPVLLGTQEGTRGQLEYLEEHLSEYRMHCPDRLWDETCQYPTLFYRVERLRVIDGGEFWLSTTPSLHRSKSWDSAFPRMMNYGFFEDLREKRSFGAVVTHLDHIGSRARIEQGRLIAKWMRSQAGPFIVMGDFNDHPDSPVHQVLASLESGLRDSWLTLGRGEDEQSMTHHDFRGVPQKFRMDWILVTSDFVVLDAEIVRDSREGLYPSDHFPYAVELEWAVKDALQR